MIVVLPGGRVLALFLIIIINHIQRVVLFNCPILHGFNDNTGILIINKPKGSPVHCQWLIASSPEQQIFIEFDWIYIPITVREYLHQGCHRGSINLWTVGLKHEKIELCGNRRDIRVGGIGRVLIIELLIIDAKLDVNFVMKYYLTSPSHVLQTVPTALPPAPSPSEKRNSVFSECGRSWADGNRYHRGIAGRIVGGRQAVPHSHPWQVLLTNRGQFCGASILNTKWLITAAHCVNGSHPSRITAEFGIHDRYQIETSRITRTVEEIVVYPSYSGQSTKWLHDIALLRLSEPLVFNPFVRSICLASVHDVIKHGERTLVTGWGATQDTGDFRYLREVEVPIQSNDQCGLKSVRWETSLCAGLCENGTCDACQGDSGGPMILYRRDRWHIVGLISWGFSCAGLGVYTKLSFYSDWILQIISN